MCTPKLRYSVEYRIDDLKTFQGKINTLNTPTDGSVCLNRVGAEFVVIKSNECRMKIGKYGLNKHNTI